MTTRIDHRLSDRRHFLKSSGMAVAAGALAGCLPGMCLAEDADAPELLYDISLGEYSLHRTIGSGKLKHIDFAQHTKEEFGINAVEYWSGPFQKKAKDIDYLKEMKTRAADHGVKSLLILVDGEGALGHPENAKRKEAVENHFKWVEAAKLLGCHSIRVNAQSQGSFEEQQKLATDGLRRLSEFAAKLDIGVIVENHGGLSSNGKWLSGVITAVGLKNCGTLPDFGNFHSYDRYLGVKELMPFAKAVSAKSHEFDAKGQETRTDYLRIMKLVVDAGYNGYVGIEYEGGKHPEADGIRLTKKLLETVRGQLA